jgi:hypothetical protein
LMRRDPRASWLQWVFNPGGFLFMIRSVSLCFGSLL